MIFLKNVILYIVPYNNLDFFVTKNYTKKINHVGDPTAVPLVATPTLNTNVLDCIRPIK